MPTYRNTTTRDIYLTDVSPVSAKFIVKAGQQKATDAYYQYEGLLLVSHEPIFKDVEFTYSENTSEAQTFNTDQRTIIDVICAVPFTITYNDGVAGEGLNSGVESFAAGAHVEVDNSLNYYVNITVTPSTPGRLSVNMRGKGVE